MVPATVKGGPILQLPVPSADRPVTAVNLLLPLIAEHNKLPLTIQDLIPFPIGVFLPSGPELPSKLPRLLVLGGAECTWVEGVLA